MSSSSSPSVKISVAIRLGMVLITLVAMGAVASAWYHIADDGPTELPPLTLDSADGKGEVDTLDATIKLDWHDQADDLAQAAGWPSRLGPSLNGVAPKVPIQPQVDENPPATVWEREAGKGYSSIVVDEQGRLVLQHRRDDREVIECCRASDGSPIWSIDYATSFVQENTKYTDGPVATPVISDGCVFTLSVQGLLHCLSMEDGGIAWQRDLAADYSPPQLAFGVGASPFLLDDLLIVTVGAIESEAGFVALDRRTGETRWTSTNHTASYTTPRLAEVGSVRHLICLTNEGLISLDPADGELRWEIPFRGRIPDSENACTPVIMDNLVIASAYGKGCIAIELQDDGSYVELWRDEKRPVLDVHYNNIIGLNGYVYGFSATDRTFRCVDARTGELISKWRSPMRRGYTIKVGDYFLLLGEHGYLAVLTLEDGKLTPVAITEEPVLEYPCYAMPTFWNGHLIVKNESLLRVAKVSK